jgi:hypothetical protein
MSIADAKPHPEYAMLVRQFNALKTVVYCLERRLADYQKESMIDRAARATLDSEREANAILTAEVEALRGRVEELENK